MQNHVCGGSAYPNGSWNLALLQQYFLPADVVEISKIRASLRQEEDIIAWGPGKQGVFSVKSAYNFAFEEVYRYAESASSSAPDGR